MKSAKKIEGCIKKLQYKDDISLLNALIEKASDKYRHLHEFTAHYLKNSLSKHKEEKVSLLEKLIDESTNPSVLQEAVDPAIEILKDNPHKGHSIFTKLSTTYNKDLRKKILKELLALIGADIEYELSDKIIDLIRELKEKEKSWKLISGIRLMLLLKIKIILKQRKFAKN